MKFDKKAQELSINTLITIILGIVIVGGGILVISKFVNKANELPKSIDSQTQQALLAAVKSGEDKIVAVPQSVKASRKEMATYGVAVVNRLEGESSEFEVSKVKKVIGEDCTEGTSCPEPQFLDSPFSIDRYNSYMFYVGLDLPKKTLPGEYVYKVTVKSQDNGQWNDYATKKLYLTVD